MKTVIATTLVVVGLVVAPLGHASPYPVYDTMVNTVQYMIDKYGLGPIDVDVAPLSDAYGQTRGNHIVFNSILIANPAQLEATFAQDVASGWIPGGCGAAQEVAIHESAHVLDWATGWSARSEFYAFYDNVQPGGLLSAYSYNADGSVNVAEALANAVVAVECGTADKAERQLYELLTT